MLTALLLACFCFGAAQSAELPGLVAYWKFNGNGDDSSGNGHNGTLVGSPGFVSGVEGTALNNSLSTYVSVPGITVGSGFTY